MMLNINEIQSVRLPMNRFSSDKSTAQRFKKDTDCSKHSTEENHCVLIFGTDKEIRFLLKTALELWKYQSEEAETVEDALRLAGQKSFDLILMDTKLTFDDSFAEMNAMRNSALLKDLPFILLSGHVQNNIRLSAAEAGAADFFVKPINLDLLEETIKTRIAETSRIKQKE